MIPGSISTLFLAPSDWKIVDTWSVSEQGNAMRFNNSLSGDIYICFAQSDDSTPDNINPAFTSTPFNEIEKGREGSTNHKVGYGIFARVVTSNGESFNADSVIYNYDSAIFFTVRAKRNFTSTRNVSWKGDSRRNVGYSDTPSHDNDSTSYSARSLALLGVFFDDDVVPPGDWVPPSDATLIGSDSDLGNGSVASAYQKLGAAGNYSWGDWGSLSKTDDWVTGIVEITEP